MRPKPKNSQFMELGMIMTGVSKNATVAYSVSMEYPGGVTTGLAASLPNEVIRVLKRARPGNGRHTATNCELLLPRI